MITVCMLAKNSSLTIRTALNSVRSFAEVIVLDNGSTDKTIEIARSYSNVSVFEAPFIGFGPLRNQAAMLASNDWILAIDTDEWLSSVLLREISALSLDPSVVYSVARDNYYNGKHIKGCGWYPDRVIRLYHRKATRYCSAEVHESVSADHLRVFPLKSPLIHIPFRSTGEFLAKMQNYSSLFALQHLGKRKSSVSKAIVKSIFTFLRSYFFQRGFLLGREGFIVSLYNSNTAFYKYLKLWEENANKKRQSTSPKS